MHRWIEEAEILEEEFRRFIRACDRMKEIWTLLSEGKSTKYTLQHYSSTATSGFTVYALQKASMYEKMSRNAHTRFGEVGGSWPAPDETLIEHVAGRRPVTEVDWGADDADEGDDTSHSI